MFMTVTMESAVFMGKNYLNNCHSIVNTTEGQGDGNPKAGQKQAASDS